MSRFPMEAKLKIEKNQLIRNCFILLRGFSITMMYCLFIFNFQFSILN